MEPSMLGLRPDANTQWNRKPSPKPSSSDSSCARATAATTSEAASESATAEHSFGRFMEVPFETPVSDGFKRKSAEKIDFTWERTSLAALIACELAGAATFAVDRSPGFVFWI